MGVICQREVRRCALFGTVGLHEEMDGAGIQTVEVSHHTLYM